MMPDSSALPQSNSVFHNQQERRIDFLYGTPETPEEHHHKSRGTPRSMPQHKRSPCTPNHLKMRADSLASPPKECRLSICTSKGGFYQLYVCERDPEFAASSGMDTEFPSFKERPDFPAVTQMQACVSSPTMKVKGCCWTIRCWDSWPPEERNSTRG